MPKGYIIAHVTVHDAERYADYVRANNEILGQRHGGRYLVRGGEAQVIEGEAHSRHVVIEFDSPEAARAAYDDPDYAENRRIRHATADSVVILAAGVP